MQSSFYMYLPSNDKSNLSNKQNDFTINLPTEKHLTGKWECALTELIYPHSWPNIKDDVEADGMKENEIYISFKNEEKSAVIKVIIGVYEEMNKVIDQINKSLNPILVYLAYSRLTRRAYCVFQENTHVTKITLSQRLQFLLGFEKHEITGNETAKYPADLEAGFHSIFIYANIVEPTIVGSSMVRLLRICPIEGKYGEIITKTFANPHYVYLAFSRIKEIEINVKDNQGRNVPFAYGTVILKLHFRKQFPFY